MRTPHPRAILSIPDERQLPRRELTADLMEAPRLKFHLDECKRRRVLPFRLRRSRLCRVHLRRTPRSFFVRLCRIRHIVRSWHLCLQHMIAKRSLLHAGALPLHRKHFLLHLILIEKVLHLPTRRVRHPRNDTEVGLPETILRQLTAQLCRRRTIPRQHQQPCNRLIEPVHDIIVRRPISVLLREQPWQIMLRILTGRLADDHILRCLMNDLHFFVFFSLSRSSADGTVPNKRSLLLHLLFRFRSSADPAVGQTFFTSSSSFPCPAHPRTSRGS